MRLILFVSVGMFTYSIQAQQQQFSNVMLLNNSNTRAQRVQNNSNRNFVNVTALNVQNNRGNIKVQTNKSDSNPVKKTNAVSTVTKNNTTRVVRQSNRSNVNRVGGPNATGNFNSSYNNVGNANEDIVVTNVFDNNVGNQFNSQSHVLENKDEQIQWQQATIPSQSLINETKESKSLNVNLDLSISKKTFSSSSSSSSSVKVKKRTFHKKYSRFKRNFYGKLFANKKSRYQVDICFNWR